LSWSPADLLTMHASVGFATLSGDGGQKRTVFLPGFTAVFAITPEHRFVGTYAPRVEMQTLSGLMSIMPFIGAGEPIRHSHVKNRGTIGVESDWTSWLRSAVSLEASTWNDYPVVADTGKTGVFGLYYGNITETLVRASVVAKLPVNHYFSAIAIVRSSKGSTPGVSVPYLPSTELTLSYRNELTDQLQIEAVIQMVSARQTNVLGQAGTVAGYTRADAQVTYSIMAGLKAWAAVRNLLDARIEHWAGYTEAPFGLNIGVAYSF